MFGCIHEGCTRHPSKGDLIVRTSPKGQHFEGLCRDHLPPAVCGDPATCTDYDPCPPCLAEARAAGLTPAAD